MSLRKFAGVAIGLRQEIALRDRALSGQFVLACSPATLGNSAAAVNAAIGGAAAKFTRTVVVKLTDTAGNIHTWFDGTFGIAASKVSAGGGLVAVADGASVATFVKGVASVVLEYTGTWAEGNTCTLTVTGSARLGYTVTNKTSVDTLVA
jgi:hypothetical protein